MTSKRDWEEAYVCVDCILFIANGDEPEDSTFLERFDDSVEWVCGDSTKTDEFSWRQCECCGSPLGGSRHQAFFR